MKEINYKEWQKNPTPRVMWVWDDDFSKRKKKKVVSVIKDCLNIFSVLTINEEDHSYCPYKHCAEIENTELKVILSF